MQIAKTKKIILAGLLILFLSSIIYRPSSLVYASVPHLINYQGRLTDNTGKPLDGAHQITFRIYDAPAAGNLLWEEAHPGLMIDKGVFSVLLGSVTNLDLAFDKPYFLEIKVDTEVMSPRQQIAASMYALKAEKSEEATHAAKADDATTVQGISANDLRGFNHCQVFDASGTFTVPIGVTRLRVQVWGAGGGGGGGSALLIDPCGTGAGGGGSGSYSESVLIVTPESNINVTVGLGGKGGDGAVGGMDHYSGTPGNNGGNSSFTNVIVYGGAGGAAGLAVGSSYQPGGNGGNYGGIGTGNLLNCQSTAGANGNSGSGNGGGIGGIGGGVGFGFGPGGQPGVSGNSPAGGGGGGSGAPGRSSDSPTWWRGMSGGNGANGKVIVWY